MCRIRVSLGKIILSPPQTCHPASATLPNVSTIPIISVVLCTYNRSELLQSVLKSLLRQSLNKSLYELVVVDNASTDNTRNIVTICQSTCTEPTIVSLYESKQGLAHARNTGWQNARGAYIAFTDTSTTTTGKGPRLPRTDAGMPHVRAST